MINHISYIVSTNTNPYYNLALEEYLLNSVKEDEVILYLWQNERTVVIGKNQNPRGECNIRELEKDGGYLVRRLSGGGAVFHDLGNLNFTFITRKDNYNVEKQLNVILKAVNYFNIAAIKSGRNDITVEGKKFSGNAFYQVSDKCYHHGTILVAVDIHRLSYYLNVAKEKLISNGVESVKSRVTNLSDYSKELTIESMKDALVHAFSQVYELSPTLKGDSEVDREELEALYHKFSSWDWIYGKGIRANSNMEYTIEKRFPWGMIQIVYQVENEKVKSCVVYTDALDSNLSKELEDKWMGCMFTSKELKEAIVNKVNINPNELQDILALLEEENL